MQIKWLVTALKNVDQEAGFIGEEDPAIAPIVVQRIVDAVNLLSANPALGHPGRVPGTRELVVPGTRYLVPYRVRPRLRRIEILRVFHAARKPPQGW